MSKAEVKKLITREAIEPMAKTAGSGKRFWKPDPPKNERISYYFNVPVMDRRSYVPQCVGWVSVRMHLVASHAKRDVFGTEWKYTIEIIVLNPDDMSPVRVVKTIPSKTPYRTNQEALRKGTNAAISNFNALRTRGFELNVLGKYLKKTLQLEEDWSEEGNDEEESEE